MKAKTYLNIILGCILGAIMVSVVLTLLAIITFISFVWYAFKSTLFLIFHPVRFFTEEEKEKDTFLNQLGKKFMDGVKNGLNSDSQTQNNGAFSENNIQIGSINRKEK